MVKKEEETSVNKASVRWIAALERLLSFFQLPEPERTRCQGI